MWGFFVFRSPCSQKLQLELYSKLNKVDKN